MSGAVVATRGLTKRFGPVVAVDRLDLHVAAGDIYGFLGLNGAGKSTTIRMLLGMIHPDRGSAELFGRRVRSDDVVLWRRVGHLVESATAYPDLTVRENLSVAARLHGGLPRAAVGHAIERLRLAPYADRRARTLSQGNLQRLALARALLHEPRLLVLDEPTNALDPAGVVEIRTLLATLARDRGVTVFVSSHILSEIQRMATRIGILHEGRLLEEITAAELERRRQKRLVVRARDTDAAARTLRQHGFDPERRSPQGQLPLLTLRDESALREPERVTKLLSDAGQAPFEVRLAQDDLEDHFMHLVLGPETRA